MGTSSSDTLYTMFQKDQREERWIEKRWEEWVPKLIYEARQHNNSSGLMEGWRDTFNYRIKTLLSNQIDWDVIRAKRLDDPRRPLSEFLEEVKFAIERRRVRIGWSRKSKKSYSASAKEKRQ